MIEGNQKSVENGSPASKPVATLKKRKRTATPTPSKIIDLTEEYDGQENSSPIKKKKKPSTPKKAKDQEKRLRRFRSHAPSTYLDKLHRATTQR